MILRARNILLSGVVHYFVNTSTEPSVALAVFSPSFDGKDSIPVEKP